MADWLSGYTILQKLGDGARSEVFQVVQSDTGKVYALKRVVRLKHEDDRFLEQAVNGFTIAQALQHPYLQRAYSLRRIRRFFRLVEVHVLMEYVDGVSLDRRGPAGIEETVDLFIKVAEGLDAMHQANLLHTDIKPNNILLDRSGAVKIIDFGQSCPIGFRKPRIQGTPDYIAPEQVQRHHLSRRTDVFNLGATLYWALTGQTFPTMINRRNKNQAARAEAPKQAPSPQELNSEVPSALSRLVVDSCATELVRRPRDMREVIARLEMVRHVLAKRKQAAPPSAPSSSAEPLTRSTSSAAGNGDAA